MSRDLSEFRLRVTYSVGPPLCYTSVLDMGRHWERIIRRARLPLAYSHGFHPHPRLFFAAPLPVGYRSRAELLDLYLEDEVETSRACSALSQQCPEGLAVHGAEEVPVEAPVLQAVVRQAQYSMLLWSPITDDMLRRALEEFMSQTEIRRERERKGRTQEYNLRELFYEVEYLSCERSAEHGHLHALQVLARCGSSGSGRPEELAQELHIPLEHWRVTRTRLVWGAEEGPA